MAVHPNTDSKYRLPVLLRRSARKVLHLHSSLLKMAYELPTVELSAIVQKEIEVQPPIIDDICLPLRDYFQHDDFVPLMKIVGSLQPRIVLELGTAFGNTVANICKHSPQTIVYTVNAPLEKQTGRNTSYSLTEQEIGRVYRRYGFADRVVQVFQNTLHLDLSQYLQSSSVDLAIIDACHDTSYVINDFFKIKPYVKPHGIVLFHDTHPSRHAHLLGSYVACMRLRRKGFDIKHIRDTWWGIWINKG